MEVNIVPLEDQHYDRYLALHHINASKNYCKLSSKTPSQLNFPNRYIYVAVNSDNVAIGSVTLFVLQKLHVQRVGLIEDVVVRNDEQRKGIGKSLVNYAQSQAEELGCYKIILSCKQHNIAFYKKCGFVDRFVEMSKYFTSA